MAQVGGEQPDTPASNERAVNKGTWDNNSTWNTGSNQRSTWPTKEVNTKRNTRQGKTKETHDQDQILGRIVTLFMIMCYRNKLEPELEQDCKTDNSKFVKIDQREGPPAIIESRSRITFLLT